MPRAITNCVCPACRTKWIVSTTVSPLVCPMCGKQFENPSFKPLTKEEYVDEALQKYRSATHQKRPFNEFSIDINATLPWSVAEISKSMEIQEAIEDAIRRAAVLEDHLKVNDVSCSFNGVIYITFYGSILESKEQNTLTPESGRQKNKRENVLFTKIFITALLVLLFSTVILTLVRSCIHAFGV